MVSRNLNFIKGKLRVLLLNGDMQRVYEEIKRGEMPSQNLFGGIELEHDHQIELIFPEFAKNSFLRRLGNFLDINLLDQQFKSLFLLGKCDVIYAPFAAASTKLLIALKLLGVVRKPIVILVHHRLFGQPSNYRIVRFIVKRLILKYDAIVFFSKKLQSEIVSGYNISESYANAHFSTSNFGTDNHFFLQFRDVEEPSRCAQVISSGNTNRDFDTVISALANSPIPLKVYCRPNSFPRTSPIPAGVEILSGEFPFKKICLDYAKSSIALIPLFPGMTSTVGLVSMLEAIGMGKPMVMTRNDYIDIDLEQLDIGITVGEGDVHAWVEAIEKLTHNSSRLKRMRENCLKLSHSALDMNFFASNISFILHSVHQRHMLGMTGRASTSKIPS